LLRNSLTLGSLPRKLAEELNDLRKLAEELTDLRKLAWVYKLLYSEII